MIWTAVTTALLATAVTVAGSVTAIAQTPGQPSGRTAIGVRLEQRSETFDYHFDNPSNFEPGPLVPHSIDQRYEADNTWLFFSASYMFLNAGAFTEIGLTPRITTPGSDIDTFYQPSGDVITSGTRGNVRLRSFSLQQRFDLASWRRLTFGVALAYRRSSMDYLPSDRIVTHSQPPSETREPVAGRETTWSHVVQSGFTAKMAIVSRARWELDVDCQAFPISRARLNISLPDKYPGEIIRTDTFGFGARGGLRVERRWSRYAASIGLTAARVWRYRRATAFREQQLAADFDVRAYLNSRRRASGVSNRRKGQSFFIVRSRHR